MLGIGGNVAIFSLMDIVLFKSLPVHNPEQLRFFEKTGWRSAATYFSLPFYKQIRSHGDLTAGMLAFFDAAGTLEVSADLGHPGASPEMLHAQLVSGNYFSVLGVSPTRGRALTVEDDAAPDGHPVAIISYSYWHRRFGSDPKAVGTRILLNGNPFTVVGVAPREFLGLTPGAPPDITVPLMMQSRIWLDPGGSIVDNVKFGWLRLMVRLRSDLPEQRVQAGLSVISRQIDTNLVTGPAGPRIVNEAPVELTPGTRGLDALRVRFSRPLTVLMALVAFVLLVACANIAALLLARAVTRQREIGTRLSLGATRLRLIRQLLIESIMIAAIGGVLGSVFAFGASELLLKILAHSPVPIRLTFAFDQRLFVFTTALTIITGLLCGIVPSLQATSPTIAHSLIRGGSVFGSRSTKLFYGRILVVLQLSLSLVLLVAAGLFVTTLSNLQGLNAGFDPANLLLVTINPSIVGYREPQLSNVYQELLQRMHRIPGVLSATMSSHGLVAPEIDDSGFAVPGRTPRPGEPRGVNLNMVGPQFFATLRTPIVLGRGIAVGDDEHAPRVGVITETLAQQYFKGENPIGKFASLGGPPLEIVGVTKDVKFNSLHDETSRVVYLPFRQRPIWHPPVAEMTFVLRTTQNTSNAVAAAIRHRISEYDRSLPITSIKTAKMQIAESLVQERLIASLSSGFGLLALVLACVGLAGTMTHAVARRTNEIGIRMAVGAQRSQVIRTFIRESLMLSLVGSFLGLGLAYALSRLATTMLFAVKATDSFTMGAATMLLIIAVVGAAFFPSWRASRVDPAVALRSE
jgi:predicted permease